ncbi:MAG: NlpC/P60 family protein [Elusimicrobiota bacterium]
MDHDLIRPLDKQQKFLIITLFYGVFGDGGSDKIKMKRFFSLFTFHFLLFTCLSCEYFIQTGIFREKEEAINQQLYLASRNYPVMLNVNGHYRIIVGPYEDKEMADFTVAKLLSEENIFASLIDEPTDAGKIVSSDKQEIEISDEVLNELVNVAFDFLGVTYKYGGIDVEKGIDCSYFMQTVYRSLGTVLPRTSNLQFKIGKKIKKDELMPGDLVFFKKYIRSSKIGHVGMYIGNDEFIHASNGAKKVIISSLNETYFKKRFSGARRPL